MTDRDTLANDLALLLDGSLSSEDRAALLAKLDEDPELRRVYADALAASEAGSQETTAATPVETRLGRRWRWSVPAIAAAAAVVIMTLQWKSPDSTPHVEVMRQILSSPGTTSAHQDWQPIQLPVTRGAPVPDGSNLQIRLVRIGMLMVDVAQSVTPPDSASRLLQLAQELEAIPGMVQIANSIRTGRMTIDELFARDFPQLNPELLVLGACVEYAAIAVDSGLIPGGCELRLQDAGDPRTVELTQALHAYMRSPTTQTRASLMEARAGFVRD